MVERPRGLESFEDKPEKKISRRDALKAIAGGIAGAASSGKERAEAAQISKQESREQSANIFQFNRLRAGVEREMQSRITLDDELKEQAKKELEVLRQQFGNDALDFVQGLVWDREFTQADPDATPEAKRRAAEKLEFVSKVFNNPAFEALFKSKLALNLEELERRPDANRGFLRTNISVGGRDIDTLMLYTFGRPADGTSGAQSVLTAKRAAELYLQAMWRQQIEPQFQLRWDRINIVPPRNAFGFSVNIRSGLPEWENESLFLVEAYGREKK